MKKNLSGQLILPNTIKKIGEAAFFNCGNITGVLKITASLKEVGDNAFSHLSQTTGIEVDSNNKCLSSFEGALYNKDYSELIVCPSGMKKVLILHSNLKRIKSGAFDHCKWLSGDYILPNGIETISGMAFNGCENLVSITIPESVTMIGYNVFYGCTSLDRIYMEGNAPNLYDPNGTGKTFLDKNIIVYCKEQKLQSFIQSPYYDTTGTWNGYILRVDP